MNPEDLRPWRPCFAAEGGTVYTAERGDRFYVVIDESIIADLLSAEDLEGVCLAKAIEFATEAERHAYLRERFARNYSESKTVSE